jgi:hypothetical protein
MAISEERADRPVVENARRTPQASDSSRACRARLDTHAWARGVRHLQCAVDGQERPGEQEA